MKWHVDRRNGIAESDYRETDVDRKATISLSPRYAAFMNRESRWATAGPGVRELPFQRRRRERLAACWLV